MCTQVDTRFYKTPSSMTVVAFSRTFMCLFCGFVLMQGINLSNSEPTFSRKPRRQITGILGRSMNFTWEFNSPQLNISTVSMITFGIWNTYEAWIEKNLMTLNKNNRNNSWIIIPNKDSSVQAYAGRVRWYGDLTEARATFELSGITDQDAGDYGIEVELSNEFGDVMIDSTKLIVKPPSVFLSSQSSVSSRLDEKAKFSWSYKLNDDDRRTLSSIEWGVYKNGVFKSFCYIKVRNTAIVEQKCLLGKGNRAHIDGVLNTTSIASFVLYEIRVEDEGEYEIRLGGTRSPLVSRTRLFITDSPRITTQPESQTLTEGQQLSISCAAYGRPAPTFSWIKDGQVIMKNSNGSFKIERANRIDAGKYQCEAVNNISSKKSNEVNVVVYYAPAINLTNKVVQVKMQIGETKSLKCPAVANPKATYHWHRDGRPYIENGHHIWVTVTKEAGYVKYTCKATNQIGEDNATFVLIKVGPPSSPKVHCRKAEDTSVSHFRKFHWITPSDDGGAPLLVYSVKYRTVTSHKGRGNWALKNVSKSSTWHQFQLEWGKVFELSVTAWNMYGESDADNTCIITVEEEPRLPSTKEPDATVTATTATSDVGDQTLPNTKGTETIPPVLEAKSQDKRDSISVDKIALYAGLCGLCVVLIIIAVVLHRCNVKRKQSKENWTNKQVSISGHMEGDFWEGPSANGKLLSSLGTSSLTRKQSMVGSPCYQMDPQWKIPREKICILKVIGNGVFGLVYKGRVHGLGTNRPGWNLVAIKSPYADATDDEIKDLMKEFELLKTLKPHPHVIKLLGCGEDEGRPLVIIEYVPYGDLLGYLRKSRGEEDDYYSDPEIKPKTTLSSQQLLRFAWQVADGMEYLSSEKIIHRDLAARNVLVGEGEVCKVTDFGMAKDVSNDDIYIRTTEGRLPVKWTAIEALIGSGEYTTQSDVWSFGVVLYEICTIGTEPYAGIAGKDIPDHLGTGYRMPRPGHVDATLYEVMASCWKTEPEDRPTFSHLQKILKTLESVQSKDYINLSECLYQNIKGKGNDYHTGPMIPVATPVAV